MPFLKQLIILSFSLLLVACGQSTINGKKQIHLSSEKLIAALQLQDFECASINGSPCPVGVARVFVLNLTDPDKSHICSGFLAAKNRLITNNHCLATISDCKNSFISIYDGTKNENSRCKSIMASKVDRGSVQSKGVDLTVIELEHNIKAKPFSPSPHRPYYGETLTAWVIDHISLHKGRITELSCHYKNRKQSMHLTHCPVIAGNSGSPLVNAYGEVVGLIWGSTADEDVDSGVPLIERRALNISAKVTELRHFINYFSSK